MSLYDEWSFGFWLNISFNGGEHGGFFIAVEVQSYKIERANYERANVQHVQEMAKKRENEKNNIIQLESPNKP